MKAIWNGSLAFGLINIPISVYPASDEHNLEFHMLHKKDLSPIRFARICKAEGNEVSYQDIVKGFEYQKGEYVVIDEKDFKAANAKKTSTIEIQNFTNINEIDPIYFEKPYFLEPEEKSGKAYQLLSEALYKTKKVAIVNFVFRNKEHLGMVLAFNEGLLLIQLRYYTEIRSFQELHIPKSKIAVKELEMAISLIEQLTKHFEPEKYHDTYVEDLMQVIEQKLKGKKPALKTKKVSPTHDAKDLMQLLQASMKKSIDETKSKKKKPSIFLVSKKPQTRKHHP